MIAKPIDFHYRPHHTNKFVPRNDKKRFVSLTYQASTRNMRVPTSPSPVMSYAPTPRTNAEEDKKTTLRIKAFLNRTKFKLPEQGPSALPLSGRGGSPITVMRRKSPLGERFECTLQNYRGNQWKDTLSPKYCTPRMVKTTVPGARHHLCRSDSRDSIDSFKDAPIVKQTLE